MVGNKDWGFCNHSWRWQPKRGRWACSRCKDFLNHLPKDGFIELKHKPTRSYLDMMIETAYRHERNKRSGGLDQ